MFLCSVIKINVPSACSLLQECHYSVWETTSCSASYVDSFCQSRDQAQQPSRTADNLLRVHSKHFFTDYIRSSELYNFTPPRKVYGTGFLTNADAGVHLQTNYDFS